MLHENERDLRETILRISAVDVRKCMKCGKCSGSCPAYEQMEYHPHQFVAMVDNGDIQALLDSDASFKCLTCYACTERCPRDVRPARLVEAVRLLKIRKQGQNHLKPDAIPAKLEAELPQQAIVAALRKYSK